MASRRRGSSSGGTSSRQPANLRIIGGEFRGRPIRYHGDQATRPMKERVREAVFNLVGPAVKGKFVIDLFSGTGAMALEAISRGAERAFLIERSFPCARVIRQNAELLGVSERIAIETSDTFVWSRREPVLPDVPRLVFFCPPYDYYLTRTAELSDLIREMIETAMVGSLIVVECDGRFDTDTLPDADRWDVRHYPPAVVGIYDVEA